MASKKNLDVRNDKLEEDDKLYQVGQLENVGIHKVNWAILIYHLFKTVILNRKQGHVRLGTKDKELLNTKYRYIYGIVRVNCIMEDRRDCRQR